MNTIRDSIPVETLLRQYIDESTEYEVRRESEPKPEVIKPMETKPVERLPDPPVEMKPVEIKPEIKPEVPMKPVEVKTVEATPQVSPVKPVEPENKSNISFNDQLETFEIPVEEENIQIGEDIPLNMLSFEDLEKSSDEIDLGIVEL